MKAQILMMSTGFFLLGAWVSYSHVQAADKRAAAVQMTGDQSTGNNTGPCSRPDDNGPPPPPPGFGPGDDGGPPPPPPPPPDGKDGPPPPPPPGQ